MSKQSVLLIGATGEAGSHILNGLLDSGNFAVVAGVRPSSAGKPEVNALRSRGVEIRILDLENSSIDELSLLLKDIDTVISAIFATQIHLQKPLADACKKAGIKRLIPCDWGPACVRGVRKMFVRSCSRRAVWLVKLVIHDYIKDVGIGYFHRCRLVMLLPYADPSKAYMTQIPKFSKYLYGTGDVKCAVTDVRDLGKFVARIIADNRTLNQYVFCWTEEVTQNEAFALAKRVSGLKFDVEQLSVDEVTRRAKEAKGIFDIMITEYNFSLWIRGDNTVENAKREAYGSALDARELYPELGKELRSLGDYAKDFYLK